MAALVMAVLGWWGLARDSAMGNDEVATRWAALLSLRGLAHLVSTVDAVHGLYYLLMHAWMAVGTSPVVMRIPSVIAMCLAAVLIAVLGRRLTGSAWVGVGAGLVMAFTPVISYYAQTARSYALVFACVLGSTLALLRALAGESPDGPAPLAERRRRWLLYAVLVALGGYLNELSLLVLAAHAVTVLLARYGRRALITWAVAGGAGALVVVPLIIVSMRESAAVAWIGRPDLSDLRILFQDYFGAEHVAAVLLLACAAVAVLPAGAAWRRGRGPAVSAAGSGDARSRSGPDSRVPWWRLGWLMRPGDGEGAPWWRSGGVTLASVALPLLVVPAGLLLAESVVLPPLYVDRYVLYGEAGAALLAAGGAYRIGQWLARAAGRRELLLVPGVVVCACALVLQIGPQQRVRRPASRLFNFGGPSAFLGAHARPGDGVLFFSKFFRKARLGYPSDYSHVSDFAMATSPEQAGDFQGIDKGFAATLPLLLAHQRIWVVGTPPGKPQASASYSAEALTLRRDYRLATIQHFKGVTVTLWVKN